MIRNLSQKIFLVIMISLSIVVLGIIILFASFNYNNTIKTSTMMLNRFVIDEPRKPDSIKENDDIKLDINMAGVYVFTVEDNKITYSNFENIPLKQYALKASKEKSDDGIISKYIYKIMREKDKITVIFMEDENVINHTKVILVLAVLVSFVALIVIYCTAKKISKVIVKPIEETFEKQKQFVSDASHELKTPLAVIEANADVLENEIGTNKWLKYIQNEIESMNKLINELLLLAKIENIDNVKNAEKFDVSKETEIIVSMFESMAYEKKITLSSNIKENIFMNGNKEDLEHILSTLLDNAIKHTESLGKVTVELSKDKNSIVLQVKNTGKPIPENEREKIFERFYRVDKSRNRKEKRYGLGLAICKSTVQKYNGKIEVICADGVTNFRTIIPM